MKYKKLHQPFIFQKNNYNHMLVSELLEKTYMFTFGGDVSIEEMWKIRYIDENNVVSDVNTPDYITLGNENYYRVAECSGYIDTDGNMSYILGAHNKKEEGNYILFLISGVFNFETKSIENYKIITSGIRAAYINKNIIYYFNIYDNNLYVNNELLLSGDNIKGSVIRIMGVYDNDDLMLVTVSNNVFETYVLNIKTKEIKKLLNKDRSNIIYKSSIIGDEDNGYLAYTDKLFDNLNNKEYYLNYEQGYILE